MVWTFLVVDEPFGLNSPLNFGKNSTRMVHPQPNMFKPSEVLPFSRFYQNYRNFCTFFPQLAVPGYSEKTEVPKMADFKNWIVTLIQFSKPFMTRHWAGLLSSLMLTEFLQHNCSLLVKKDFSFCRRYLTFLLLLLSSATESSHQMIRLNPFLFSWWAKTAVPVVQKQSTEKSIQIVSTPSGNS